MDKPLAACRLRAERLERRFTTAAADPPINQLPSRLALHVGDAEVVLDDSTRFAARAREAGVDVTLEVWDEMPHVWHPFAGLLPEADQAIGPLPRYQRSGIRRLWCEA